MANVVLQDEELTQDLFFEVEEKGATNVVLIPAGWARFYGPGTDEEFPDENEPDAYGYYPTRLVSNDERIETGWIPMSALTHEVTEGEAREIHPALFEHLNRIDRGEL